MLLKVYSMGNVLKDRSIDCSLAAIEGMSRIDGGDVVSIATVI